MINYKIGNELDLDEVVELYRDSGLGERRPIDDVGLFRDMIRNANLIITAWDGELLIGIARSISDFSYVTYLSDLAIRKSYQKKGIGKELIKRTRKESGPKAKVMLLSAPIAKEYYSHIGFKRHDSAWVLKASDEFDG